MSKFTAAITKEGGVSYRVEFTSTDLGYVVASALVAAHIESPRLCSIVAKVVAGCVESMEGSECWPGYREAIQEMAEAAHRIIEGWSKHDEAMKKSITK